MKIRFENCTISLPLFLVKFQSNDYYKIVSVDNTVMKTNAKIEQIKATTVSSVKTVLFDFARDITYPTKCCSIGKFNMSHVQPVTVSIICILNVFAL